MSGDGCAKCCEYFMFEIAGNNKQWISELSEFLKFTRPDLASIMEEGENYLLKFKAPCQYLKDKKCSIYEDRPKICREFFCRKAKQNISEEDGK